MNYLNLIRELDGKLNYERLEIIIRELEKLDVPYETHTYTTGTNLIVDIGNATKKIGISSHFDKVQKSAGANDNASAIAVCLDIIKKFKEADRHDLNLRVFFCDQEETGLKGSAAYVKERGIKDLVGLMNMEMVGMGDKFALWPVNENSDSSLLTTFESVAATKNIVSKRFDRVITNTADHLSFQKAGLRNSFTISCISDKDLEISHHYFKAIEFGVDKETLFEILSTSPLFEHYHKPTDTFEKLSEESILMTSNVVWETVMSIKL